MRQTSPDGIMRCVKANPPKKLEEGEQHMSEENKAVVRREMEELFNHTGNLDAVEEIIGPDYVGYEPTSGETRGIEGARQFAATYREAFPDLENTIEDMVAEGDKVVMRFSGSGTHEGETTEAFGPP